MRLYELTKFARSSVDQSLPYDDEHEDTRMRGWHLNEPWRGPHEGRYLTLMLAGKKPAILINDDDLPRFQKYIDSGELMTREMKTLNDYQQYVLTIPGQEWRAKRLQDLYDQYDKYSVAGKDKLWHARVGMLLGYSNEDIRKFIKTY